MDVREKLVELSDIQVLQREMECVKRNFARFFAYSMDWIVGKVRVNCCGLVGYVGWRSGF